MITARLTYPNGDELELPVSLLDERGPAWAACIRRAGVRA